MRIWFFYILLLPHFLLSTWDDLFSFDEDPSLFQHVHVISGQLTLLMEDTVLQGAHPLSLLRTYTSSGALDAREGNGDLAYKELRGGWLIQGGWNFLPHANLVVHRGPHWQDYFFQLAEPSGNILTYRFDQRVHVQDQIYHYYYKPQKKKGGQAGMLGAKQDPSNNVLMVRVDKRHPKDFTVSLFLPSGGSRQYRKLVRSSQGERVYYYKLVWEDLPSGRCLDYQYDSQDRLHRIEVKNPSRTKTHGFIQIDVLQGSAPFCFHVTTSDNRSFCYQGVEINGREYIEEVRSSSCPTQRFTYTTGQNEIGSRIHQIWLENRLEAQVEYYESSKSLYKRDEAFYQKHKKIDRVKTILAPTGENGDLQPIASFRYFDTYTEVQDEVGAIYRYHYQQDKITCIERFDQERQHLSSLVFLWKRDRLIAKVFLDETRHPVFSKTFFYDAKGNVVRETLWGNISGSLAPSNFCLQKNGSLTGAESFYREYQYDIHSNALIYEKEEGGLGHYYSYQPHTDLLTKKITVDDRGIIVQREFFSYDADHFLTSSIIDNGQWEDVYNVCGATHRWITRYTVDQNKGLITSMSKLYVNLSSHTEHPMQSHTYGYQAHNLIEKDEVYDSQLRHRYTLFTQYDDRGNVLMKTTPNGDKNYYQYDQYNHLITEKEVGLPKKQYRYDRVGRRISCAEIDEKEAVKVSYNTYSSKGWIASQTDYLGNSIHQTYDCLGRCLSTEFPPIYDENGSVYTPITLFRYDALGNLINYTNPRGEQKQTQYNVFQKPCMIVWPDGTATQHIYARNGSLSKTIEPDGTNIVYQYDDFGHVIHKLILSVSGEVLSEESWTYDTFHLLSYKDPYGITTVFSYNEAGRKIEENVQGRMTRYTYDALGFLESTFHKEMNHVSKHDMEGNIIEKWDEKDRRIENHMIWHYKSKGILAKSHRLTSQGEAIDLFAYDAENRLCQHTDPLGSIKRFLYYSVINTLGQAVLCKETVDHLGYKTLEIEDACHHLVRKEKQDSSGQTIALEEFLYDRAGNVAKHISTVYQKNRPIKRICNSFTYDAMGRMMRESLAGIRNTQYTYTAKGEVASKTLPTGVVLWYQYDGLGRLQSIQSSDHTIHYSYQYAQGPNPVLALDHIHQNNISRSYSSFGELIEEHTPTGKYTWEYDTLGRCFSFTLPNCSSIAYGYDKGELKTVTRRDSVGCSRYQHTYASFDVNGHVQEENLICQLGTVDTKYDLLERLVQQKSTWNTHIVGYDVLGRIQNIEHSLHGKKKMSYDGLGQIEQEGEIWHQFDSIGNSLSHETNDLNEVIDAHDSRLTYDANGNIIMRTLSTHTISYTYDALGRLQSISYPDRRICYTYDPLSRLVAKVSYDSFLTEINSFLFLYDQDQEIGLCDRQGNIVQLKVLGRGIAKEVGAAIAMELEGAVYAPLHDVSGNCVALISTSGQVVESYSINVFGEEPGVSQSYLNPWRFSSKRHEEHLVFFGQRFYDCFLKRWLTPDPAGCIDGVNLYVYVGNSPMNRLDLFGLYSDPMIADRQMMAINAQVNSLIEAAKATTAMSFVRASAMIDGVPVDMVLACGHWHKMQFSAEEQKIGSVNLRDHFAELLPDHGQIIGLISAQNGINTSWMEFEDMSRAIVSKVPEGTLFIGMHNPSEGLLGDLFRVQKERNHIETPIVRKTAQFMQAIAHDLHKINPELLWLDIRHSEAALIARRSIEHMPQEDQYLLQQHWMCIALGPAAMIPLTYGNQVNNIYSKKDFITGRYAKEGNDGFRYNVSMIHCITPMKDRTLWFADHAFLGKTYQTALTDIYDKLRQQQGFYHGKNR